MSIHARRKPGLVVGGTSVIAAGVGLAAMVVALADVYALKPLPYADPNQLVSITFGLPSPQVWGTTTQADLPSLESWRARTDLFDGVAAFEDRGWLMVQLQGRTLPLRAVAATDNLLEVLGLQPPPSWAASDEAGAWVSSSAATTLFGGARLEPSQSFPVLPAGVLRARSLLPRSFLLPDAGRTLPVDALVLLQAGPVLRKDGFSISWPSIVGRMRPGVTPRIVEDALSATTPGMRVSARALSDVMTARLRPLALGGLVASALLVVLSWANVFNIGLTRGLYRTREISTRVALGAKPSQILGLLLTEALRVTTLGAAAALAIAWTALAGAKTVAPPQFATLGAPSITTRVVLFVACASGIAGVSWCASSILAWRLGTRHSVPEMMGRDGRTIQVVRFAVIAGQLGIATALLTAATMLGRSYLNLVDIDVAMNERTETLTVTHDSSVPPALRRQMVEETVIDLRKTPGVQAVGATFGTLLDGRTNRQRVVIGGQVLLIDWNFVVGDYFGAMGLEFLAGGAPRPDQSSVAVINESLARQAYPGRMPINELLPVDSPLRIVGVVRDVRDRGLSQTPLPAIFEVGGEWLGAEPQTTYLLRVGDQSHRVASWENAIRRRDPLAVVLESGTIGQRLGRSVRDRTFATVLVSLFALACVVVTALGLTGVVAYTVVKRTREIAIRLALGSPVQTTLSLVVRNTLLAATSGIIGGVVASCWLSKGLESLLYQISPADPLSLALAGTGLLGIAAVAALAPALQATRIPPAMALRTE